MDKAPKITKLPNQPKEVKVSEDACKPKVRVTRGKGAATKGYKSRGPMA